MKSIFSFVARAAILSLLVNSCFIGAVRLRALGHRTDSPVPPSMSQSPAPTTSPTPQGSPPPAASPRKQLLTGDETCKAAPTNGITIGQTKLFDEGSLALMLRGLELSLAKTQGPDASTLYPATGRLQGATANTSSLSVTATGLPLPSVATTENAATKLTESITGTGTTSGSEANNSTNVVTTQAALNPATPALPAQTSIFSFQPGFGVSATDLLAEQTALTYQIINLRMLLERSLSDRLIGLNNIAQPRVKADEDLLAPRLQAVVGFQVSVESAYKDAIAEVEITLTDSDNDAPEAPSVISLIPQEKTYNVATVTKDAKSINLGAIAQVVNVGASYGRTQESVYLIKDSDTVSLERVSDNQKHSTTFVWQFRPVLGRRTVESGTRQVYALVALPAGSLAAGWRGKITATTRWRRFDRSKKIVGSMIGNQGTNCLADLVVPLAYNVADALRPHILDLHWQDAGNGQVLVFADGVNFTPDTKVIIGNTVLDSPQTGLNILGDKRLSILASGQKIGMLNPLVMGQFGSTPLGLREYKEGSDAPFFGIAIEKAETQPFDAQNSLVHLVLRGGRNFYRLNDDRRPVVEVGNQIFGLSDYPFKSFTHTGTTTADSRIDLTFVAPTQLLASVKKVVVRELIGGGDDTAVHVLNLADVFTIGGITTLGSADGKAHLAISGSHFTNKVTVTVGGKPFQLGSADYPLTLNSDDGNATLITLGPPVELVKNLKYVVVTQPGSQPSVVSLTPPPADLPTAKILVPADSVSVKKGDSKKVRLVGANFESVKDIQFEGKSLTFELDKKDKTVMQLQVTTIVTGDLGDKEITLIMKDDQKVPYTIKVISP